MNYDEAKAILKELYKDRPDQITSFTEVPGGEITTCSFGTNNYAWFKHEKGVHGWDLLLDQRFLEYRMYVLDIRLQPVKVPGTKHIMIKKIEPVELRTFLQEQLRLADKARR
jgi:hypothetical protein